MKGRTTQIADDLVDAINANDFSISFTALRQYMPRVNLSDLSAIRVFVIPRGVKRVLLDRGRNTENYHQIEIGVQYHVSDVNDAATVDPITHLLDELQEFVIGVGIDGADCVEVQSILADESIFAKEHLQQDNVLTNVMVGTFLEV